jgi:hypothetical protein
MRNVANRRHFKWIRLGNFFGLNKKGTTVLRFSVALLALNSTTAISAELAPKEACEKIYTLFSSESYSAIKEELSHYSVAYKKEILDAAKKCEEKDESKTTGIAQFVNSDAEKEKKLNDLVPVVKDTVSEQITSDVGLKSFNFAMGIGSLYLSKPDIIDTVSDNGTLRITSKERNKIGIWASTNTFFYEGMRYRFGAFVGAQIGSDNSVVNSIAVGLAIAASRNNLANPQQGKAGSAPLVFQLGYGVTRTHSLTSGYADGQALPAGTNQAITTKETTGGPVVLVSYAF